MKSKNFRESQKLLRNEFYYDNEFEIPVLKKDIVEINNLELLSFDNTDINENQYNYKTVHFFLDDYKFEKVFNNYATHIKRLTNYKYLITPDFSLYPNMSIPRQIYNIFKNRWCGAYWQSMGLEIIPSVNWSDAKSFNFCFLGIPKNSCVAVSTIGNRKAKKEFMLGYEEMIIRIEPEIVICHGKPFNEMYDLGNNILHTPYRQFINKYKGAV